MRLDSIISLSYCLNGDWILPGLKGGRFRFTPADIEHVPEEVLELLGQVSPKTLAAFKEKARLAA